MQNNVFEQPSNKWSGHVLGQGSLVGRRIFLDKFTSIYPSKKTNPTKGFQNDCMENVICPEPENQETRRHISDSPLLLAGRAKSRLKLLKISIWCGFECWSMKDSKCASLSKRHLNTSKLLTKLVIQYPPVAAVFQVTRSKEERLFGLDSSQVSYESGHL